MEDVTHPGDAWWRIRVGAESVAWDVSPDGSIWTQLASAAVGVADDIRGTLRAGGPTDGFAEFDDLSVTHSSVDVPGVSAMAGSVDDLPLLGGHLIH
jgi:hypothetical protein